MILFFEVHLDVQKCIYCWVLPLSALRVCMHAYRMFGDLYPRTSMLVLIFKVQIDV